MKLFTKNTIRNLALSALSAAVLSACGGAGSCNTPPSGNLTLSISAPSQYPAGIPITAYLTMTNTSNTNGTNLVYTVPSATNYTGVTITPDANGAGQNCANIEAGASCTFTALIPAGSKPGSFTVTATPNGSATQSAKAIQTGKSLQAGSISVTANLGLVDVPNTQNEYYVLPSDQTVQGSTGSPSTVYVSVWVKTAGAGLNSLKLVDETGAALTYESVGTLSYTANSVNSYKVTIPAGKTVQHIQALSNVCTTFNNGENNNTACSNDADVNLAQSGVGILAIQPNYFQMSTSHESQVVTLQNIGTANITAMQMPVIAAPFKVLANTCTGITSLAPAASCSVTIGYTPASSSGQGSYVINYNNGTSNVNTSATIPYTGTSPAEVGILTAAPASVSLTGNNAEQLISLTNTSNSGVVSNLVLPTLSSPLELKSPSSCVNGLTLAAGASCTYRIGYSATVNSGNFALAFGYNNGQQNSTTNVALDWSTTVPVGPTITIISIPNPVESVMMGNGFQFTAILSGTGSSMVSAEFANPAAGIITSEPSPCALDSVGVTSCTFTVMTAWDTSLANSLDNLAYKINISATNLVSVTGNPVAYTQLTPTVYLPQTGQTPSAPIDATAGMDGFVHAGIPWAYVTSGITTPAKRFTVGTGDEVDCITDNLTGLMWPKNGLIGFEETNGGGPIAQPNYANTYKDLNSLTWTNALIAVANMNTAPIKLCGHDDWYLPTINDLASLLNDGEAKPGIWLNGQGFSNIQRNLSNYWSSSNSGFDNIQAWAVSFNNGNLSTRDKGDASYYVWPVRRPSSVATAPAKVAMTGETGGATGSNQGVAWPNSRFLSGSGATVECITDKLTGLMWPKNGIIGFEETNGGGLIAQPNYTNTTTNLNTLNWDDALTAVANMNTAPIKLCGYSDWRLPNKVELRSLVNYGIADPSTWLMYGSGTSVSPVCSGACFSNVQDYYWSSSTWATAPSSLAWVVNFSIGAVNSDSQSSDHYVWPVRGGL